MTKAAIVTSASTYHVSFELENDAWLAQVDEIPQVHTFATTLGKAREHVIDALALWLNVPVQALHERVTFASVEVPRDTQKLIDRATLMRRLASSTARATSQAMSEAAFALVRRAHLSRRDASELLGVSHQRVQQLVNGYGESTTMTADTRVVAELGRALRRHLPQATPTEVAALADVIAVTALATWVEWREA